MFGSYIWEILVIVGPIVLAAAIGWAMLHNRQSKREYRRTEESTREFYRQEDADNKAHDGIERS